MINIIQFLTKVEEISKKVKTTLPTIISIVSSIDVCVTEIRKTIEKSN
jgi:hypothetical protein